VVVRGKKFFFFVFVFSILMPTFHNIFDSAGVLVVNGSLIVFLFVYLVFKNGYVVRFLNTKHKNVALGYIYPIFFMFALTPLSMAVGYFFGGVNLIQRDMYEFYKPILYFLIFIYSFLFFSNHANTIFFENALVVVFLLVFLLGLNHYFRYYDFILELYTKTRNVTSGRVSAPFVNPYDFAFFMTFFVYYFFMKTLFYKKKYIFLFMLSIIMLILPQSRSVIVGFLVGFFLIMPFILNCTEFNIKKFTIKKRLVWFYIIFIVIMLLLLSSLSYLIENFKYLTGQFVRLIESGDIGNSAGLRVEQFLFALDKAVNNPLILFFGNGPAKDEMEHVESIYNYLFYRYGLIGISFYFYILFFAAFQAWKIVKYLNSHSKHYSLFYASLIWLLTIPLVSIGNNFTEQVRLSFFYYMMVGFIAASYFKIVKGEKN